MRGGRADDEEPIDPLDGDPPPVRPVPHRLDRLWRHPSELPRLPRRRALRGHLGMAIVPLVAGATGALITVGVLASTGLFDREERGPDAAAERAAEDEAAVAQLVSEAAPAIVAVATRGGTEPRRGSGVALRHRGDVLTSAHLVDGASDVAVVDARGHSHDARLLGVDRDADLALLRVDGSLSAAHLSETRLAPGDRVLVVGAPPPAGDDNWVSTGVVASTSAVVGGSEGTAMDGLIETDAEAGDAAAGGALLDRTGAVVGIVLSPVEGEASTYALPIEVATGLAEQLRSRGWVEHGRLGIEGADTPEGPAVLSVTEGGPAATAGVQPGDVIVEIDGRPVMNMTEVSSAIRHTEPGREVMLKVRRSDAFMTLDARVARAGEEESGPGSSVAATVPEG